MCADTFHVSVQAEGRHCASRSYTQIAVGLDGRLFVGRYIRLTLTRRFSLNRAGKILRKDFKISDGYRVVLYETKQRSSKL